MPITNDDIVIYGSQVMPEDDTAQQIGGGIDLTTVMTFVDAVSLSSVEVVSSSAADTTQTLTITGRRQGGSIVTETRTLNGTSVVAFPGTWERFLKFELSGVAAGVVTVRRLGNTLDFAIFNPGVTTVRRPFYLASADAAGGVDREFHEKVFIRNNNATLDLTEATVIEASDPGSNITFALETSLDGSDTNGAGNNRLVAPGGYSFTSANKPVANSQNLLSESAQGVWLKLDIPAGTAPAKNTYTLRVTGKTI